MNSEPIPARVAKVASKQHGVASMPQLIAAGWSRNQVQRRIQDGYLTRLHQGVYAVGHVALTQNSRWMAAVLFAGRDAVLSHRSAAALWKLAPCRSPVEVTRQARTTPVPGLKVHRTKWLPENHRTVCEGIPVTTPARTLADLASVERLSLIDDRISAARRERIFNPAQTREVLRQIPSRRGVRALREKLDLFDEIQGTTRSELETRFLRLCCEADLPLPEVDVQIGSTFADFLWREKRLIVEVDGFRFHHHRFDEDRERDLGRLTNGYRTVRVTHRMIRESPGRLMESLRRLVT
jgi:hypothetical protein